MIKTFYVPNIDPNKVFGMVGRCGGGQNTMWQDWSPVGRAKRELIMAEFEAGINEINGHYEKLEKSMLAEGIRNPAVLTCGRPIRRRMCHLPPEMRSWHTKELLLCEGVTGGSRLYIAQKHNIPLPCIINDQTGRFWQDPDAIEVKTTSQALSYFKDRPKMIQNSREGIQEQSDTAHASHLEEEFRNMPVEMLIQKRGAMWLEIMKKYGYTINLNKRILDMIYGK